MSAEACVCSQAEVFEKLKMVQNSRSSYFACCLLSTELQRTCSSCHIAALEYASSSNANTNHEQDHLVYASADLSWRAQQLQRMAHARVSQRLRTTYTPNLPLVSNQFGCRGNAACKRVVRTDCLEDSGIFESTAL